MEDEQINKIKFVSEDSFYIEELKKGTVDMYTFSYYMSQAVTTHKNIIKTLFIFVTFFK